MRGPPKRYVRLLVFLALFIVPVAVVRTWLQWHRQASHTLMKTVLFSAAPEERNNIKAAEALRAKYQDGYFIASVGVSSCFYIGNFFEVCPSFARHRNHHIQTQFPLEREFRIVHKDLTRTSSLRLAGFSRYLSYETISVEQVVKFLTNSEEQIYILEQFEPISERSEPLSKDIMISLRALTEKSVGQTDFVTELDVLFGSDSVEPRVGWHMSREWAIELGNMPKYISVKKHASPVKPLSIPRLEADSQGTFKIVQLADLHYSVGEGHCRDEFPKHDVCHADLKTLSFIEKVLDAEKPQLVVFTGDQIMGDTCFLDSATALLKVVNPVIKRKIPYAIVWGNHDDDGSLDRWQLSLLARSLPFSIFQIGEQDTNDRTFGVGNYAHHINDENGNPISALYFLDSHKMAPNPKVNGAYDWIKEDQWKYFQNYENSFPNQKDSLSMAFFHIPLPEYLNFQSKYSPDYQNPMVGKMNEGITAPRYNSEGLKMLRQLGVKVTSVGHDHCNDFCLLDDSQSPANEDKIWLCYGGAAGEGGYAGYGGTERRIRVYQLDFASKKIETWKVLNSSPSVPFDQQVLVNAGSPKTD